MFRRRELLEPDGANEEEDSVGEETDDLHSTSTVEFVVDEESSEVVSA